MIHSVRETVGSDSGEGDDEPDHIGHLVVRRAG